MKTESRVLTVVAAALALTVPALSTPLTTPATSSVSPTPSAQDEVAAAANAFSLRLYQTVMNAEEGNFVISPLSVAVLLALTRHGAYGSTADQLTSVLQLPSDRQATAEGYQALLHAMQITGPATLRIANKMYAQKNYNLKETFRRTAINSFQAATDELDFVNDSENARLVINQWAEESTQGKIKDLFQPGVLTPDTVLVLVNAIYFKAGWFKPFDPEDTNVQSFHINDTVQKNTTTMHGVFQMEYGEVPELNATALRLEYDTEENMDMILLVPNSMNGLPQVEDHLNLLDLNNLTPKFAEVNLTMPKFKVESKYHLKENLIQLGISEIFAPTADLRGMVDPGAFIENIIQKTFIGVDEKGTEAAVATGQNFFYRTSYPGKEVTVDHPFFFMIRKGNTILFLGRVVHPQS